MSIAKEHRWLLLAVCAAQFFMPFMVAGVNAVLPPLGESLGASARELSLLGAVYTLGLVVFQLAGGTLGDIYGRRRVFL
ncbi:MFS transporter, partial [Desulfovibrio piger]